MAWDLELPHDVVEYVRSVFRRCNEQTSAFMTAQPNVHEVTLDHAFIHHLDRMARPQLLPSKWLVTIETHFLGGGRHYGLWEIADIGVLVVFRKSGRVERTKVGLLQSKRLYPNEQSYDEAEHEDYLRGFGRLFGVDKGVDEIFLGRQYTFAEDSQYRAFRRNAKQHKNIDAYELVSGIPVYYLFYNPWLIPWTVTLPVEHADKLPPKCSCGCRVVPTGVLNDALKGVARGASPSYADVRDGLPKAFKPEEHPGGWRLEYFITELLSCRLGYYSDSGLDNQFQQLFGARTAAIASAFSVTIDSP